MRTLASLLCVIVLLATSAAVLLWRRLKPGPQLHAVPVPPLPQQEPPVYSPLLPAEQRELALAIEHIQSIRVLLEISRFHRQQVPTAVLRNLELVVKSLSKLQVEAASNPALEARAELAISPESQCAHTPHPRRPFWLYRTSPYDT
jgi:hypothetical protein